MKRYLLAALLIFLIGWTCLAQSRKTKKPKPILAKVTIVGEKMPAVVLLKENDAGTWNEFSAAKFQFKITFPTKPQNVFDDCIGKISYFETATDKATYRLMVSDYPTLLNNREIDALLDNVIQTMFDKKRSTIISKRDVYFGGKIGKELIFEDNLKQRREYFRVFLIAQKQFILTVSIAKNKHDVDFDKWAMKFLDSFWVEIKETKVG